MIVVIAGSRGVTQRNKSKLYQELMKAVVLFERKQGHITEVVSGGCKGSIDELGERFAKERRIPCTVMPADWRTFGKRAGILRNIDMAVYADGGILLWDGKSHGTANMKHELVLRKKPLVLRTVGESWTRLYAMSAGKKSVNQKA